MYSTIHVYFSSSFKNKSLTYNSRKYEVVWFSHCYNLLFPTLVFKLGSERCTVSLWNILNNIFVTCFQRLMFLVYPLLGCLADVYLTSYCTLKCGLVNRQPFAEGIWLLEGGKEGGRKREE